MRHPVQIEKKAEAVILTTDADALLWNSLLVATLLFAFQVLLKFGF